ncbi:hypothetical protein FJR48_01135 [Sulfurimonas lithotrophica]|uniref:Uncharacterized protein n=1 Tax=Sulfurimonas lithotrophica TaxID=2590022 RepID=A0A5P8NY91_9BACT|nr:hypothetical protein [Sulfurimonas lithotrophica]QFR48398.1 hypothetical protein FJR48_01135 [Sulfurimonas lithotrophica]
MNDALKKLKKITKNKEESIKLLKSALSKKEFLSYLNEYFHKDDLLNEINFSAFRERLSEDEFQQIHVKYHCPILWKTLQKQSFTSIDAIKPIKWLSITYQLIENDIIEPHFLAFFKNNKNGRNNIIEALRLSSDGDNSGLTEVSNAILRHMFGWIGNRGIKGIMQDVPFAVAWWRMHLAKEIERETGIKEQVTYNYLSENKSNYNALVESMSGKLTVVADKSIRDGFFLYIMEKSITKTQKFKDIIAKIGIESTWRGMGSLSPIENKKIIQSLIE